MHTIILSRHADNKLTGNEGKIPTDGALHENGLKQAEEMSEFLKDFTYEIAFSSLYLRTNQTLDIINQNKNIKQVKTVSFNEYFLRPDGSGVESVDNARARTMSKIYSLFELYDSILIMGHSSINQTILQSLLNLEYEESRKYFKNFGETHVLRYDWDKGDTNWKIFKSFIPHQF